MPRGSDDSRIHAEAIVKAACINAAATLIVADNIPIASDGAVRGTAYAAMEIWNLLEKPDSWPR